VTLVNIEGIIMLRLVEGYRCSDVMVDRDCNGWAEYGIQNGSCEALYILFKNSAVLPNFYGPVQICMRHCLLQFIINVFVGLWSCTSIIFSSSVDKFEQCINSSIQCLSHGQWDFAKCWQV
jgi:hypothetical protein